MKLEPPLANLVNRCQTLCVAECCGIDAYDFSPIQIASYLTMHRGEPDAKELDMLRDQIEAMRANYGTSGARGCGAISNELNQNFTAEDIEKLADELLVNLEVAVKLIQQSENLRYKNAASS